MGVPKKHDDEPRTEVQGDLYADWAHAKAQAKIWEIKAKELEAKLLAQMGSATGGMVGGRLVCTYRYKNSYAVAALVRDNPALTEHYMKEYTTNRLDIDTFALVHPEIARKYQVREFKQAGTVEEEEANAE